ncbi:MAG TPA: hypothetical protein VNA57_13780 [Acidimicrobiales bacterium]|nr:hypothetical protein [Acidimicrobiales bacterium]
MAARAVVALTFLAAHALVNAGMASSDVAVHHLHQGLLGWDAERYTGIAERGYAGLPLVELRFFPLLPMLARALGAIVGSTGLALILIANVAALGFGALVHALCLHERGDERLARRATWFAAFTPAAFVLVWGYSEAVWGCLAVGTVLALRRRWWWAAAALALLGGLARPVGALLVLPALVEAGRGLAAARGRELAARVAAVAAPLAGTGAFLAWVGAKFGDPLLPFRIQQDPKFRGELADPVSSLLAIVGTTFRDGLGVGSARLVWAGLLVGLVVGACRAWPASYGALATAALLVALSTDHLGSFERYGFAAFPVVLHLAAIARTTTAQRVVVGLGAGAMAVYGTLALLGRYVP